MAQASQTHVAINTFELLGSILLSKKDIALHDFHCNDRYVISRPSGTTPSFELVHELGHARVKRVGIALSKHLSQSLIAKLLAVRIHSFRYPVGIDAQPVSRFEIVRTLASAIGPDA